MIRFFTSPQVISPIYLPPVNLACLFPHFVCSFSITFHTSSCATKLPAITKSIRTQSTESFEADIVAQSENVVGTHHWIWHAFWYTFVHSDWWNAHRLSLTRTNETFVDLRVCILVLFGTVIWIWIENDERRWVIS